jgi:hypothetical protein
MLDVRSWILGQLQRDYTRQYGHLEQQQVATYTVLWFSSFYIHHTAAGNESQTLKAGPTK